MADYRLSAAIISRKAGQSSVACAAYRSGSRLMDERTGEVRDFSRKGGVLHSEILAPANTPDWMRDRAQLWNAVEKAERRGDAQLAREVQLSLPHELTQQQRQELVRDFVQRQFVDHGLIADVAIHAPGKVGDQRNHHAHVMLTMRELTGDGFGKKLRNTMQDKKAQLAAEREAWAEAQNRALERHGHDARVDHRSYADQGIDREPSNHLGPTAHKMEKRGQKSRIGNDNRAVQKRNDLRTQWYAAEFKFEQYVDRKRRRLERWISRTQGQAVAELEAAQSLNRLDRTRKHEREKARLQDQLDRQYGEAKRTLTKQAELLQRQLEAKGIKAAWQTLTGARRQSAAALDDVRKTLADISRREQEQAAKLEAQQRTERRRYAAQQAERRAKITKRFDRLRDARKRSRFMDRDRAGPDDPKFEKRVEAKPDPKRKLEERPHLKGTYERTDKPSVPAPDRPHPEHKNDGPAPAPRGQRGRPWSTTRVPEEAYAQQRDAQQAKIREQEADRKKARQEAHNRLRSSEEANPAPSPAKKSERPSQKPTEPERAWWKKEGKDAEKSRSFDDQALRRNWWKSSRSDDAKPEPSRDPSPGKGRDPTRER